MPSGRDADGQDPGIANVIDAFLTARGGLGATEDEIMALFRSWNLAQVTCGAFQLIADGKKEFLVDFKDGEPHFFKPAADWKPPDGPRWKPATSEPPEPPVAVASPPPRGPPAASAAPAPRRRGRPSNRGPCDRCGAPDSKRDPHAKVYRCGECWQRHYEARERKEAEKPAQVETLEEQTVIEEQTPEPPAAPPAEPTVEIDGLVVPESQITAMPGSCEACADVPEPRTALGKAARDVLHQIKAERKKKRREPRPAPPSGSPAAEQEGWKAAKAGAPESACPYDFDDCKRRDSWLLGHRNWHAKAGSGV